MAPPKRRRRAPGEGSEWPYRTKGGLERWAITFPVTNPDGSVRKVTRRRGPHGEKWTTRREASRARAEAVRQAQRGEYVDPSRQRVSAYLAEWADGLRLAPATVASYRRNIRLHVDPYVGSVPLASLTAARLDVMYRQLEARGSTTGKPLSARTVRYIHAILHNALAAALRDNRLVHNPASRAHPPTPRQMEAQRPEMRPWTAEQAAAFLAWAAKDGHQHAQAWRLLATTGMRRGEALALRWHDVDLDAGTVAVRRSAGVVRVKGEPGRIVEGPTKSGKARVVDLGAETAAALKMHRRTRGAMALQLVQPGAFVFGDHEGRLTHPEYFSQAFADALVRCSAELGDSAPPVIRLHDLRHTHATLLLSSGTPVKVVSERLGHASPVITMTVYAHVLPGGQRAAAAAFDALLDGVRS